MRPCAFFTGIIILSAFFFNTHSLPVHAQQSHVNEAGIRPYSPELAIKIKAALVAKGVDYKPRSEHLFDDGAPKFSNRLIMEDSPYLLQHAHNPVNWYPWGTEAFAVAKRENKPVFLSIGYSTCHWCHVMERESFENVAIARFMNQHFISIKVDRERRPDIDKIYMTAVTLLTGSGGWPMSSFLTPDAKTFYGGTYFPPDKFLHLLERADQFWNEKQMEMIEQAEGIALEVERVMSAGEKARAIDLSVINQGVINILRRYDELEGGFGRKPKFPNENLLLMLLEAAKRRENPQALAAAEHSLQAMARGGIHDQIGGGFHRYATDSHWLVPHFEKMLYNQANLTRAYLAAYELTGKQIYARVVRQTLDYVLREMTAAGGGFYSATDADSEGREGAFFIWTPARIREALNVNDAELAIELFGMTTAGNFEGKNILYLPYPLDEFAKQHQQDLPQLLLQIDRIRGQLRIFRARRPAPDLDNKIISAWNGMMITALAEAGSVLKEKHYLRVAEKAAHFLWNNNRDKDNNRLWRSNLNGRPSVMATQADYAYLAQAFISLFDYTGEVFWLERAETVAKEMLSQFRDKEAGGFFMNSASLETPMMTRPKDGHDAGMASGNSVALRVLSMLAKRTGNNLYLEHAEATLAAFAASIRAQPDAYSYMLLGAWELLQNESGHRQYAARGAVVADASIEQRNNQPYRLNVDINIQQGWHINARHPLDKRLVPTTIAMHSKADGWIFEKVEYPQALVKRLGFSKDQLALYAGSIRIRAGLKNTTNPDGIALLPVKLRLQACNDEICLPPETLILNVPTI